MLNGKDYIDVRSIGVMGDITKIDLKRSTLKDLRIQKALGEFPSYDEMLKYWLKHDPITAPVSGEGGE